jgi:hypothetical protein
MDISMYPVSRYIDIVEIIYETLSKSCRAIPIFVLLFHNKQRFV